MQKKKTLKKDLGFFSQEDFIEQFFPSCWHVVKHSTYKFQQFLMLPWTFVSAPRHPITEKEVNWQSPVIIPSAKLYKLSLIYNIFTSRIYHIYNISLKYSIKKMKKF